VCHDRHCHDPAEAAPPECARNTDCAPGQICANGTCQTVNQQDSP
jgi:Cys-rich repeat protein